MKGGKPFVFFAAEIFFFCKLISFLAIPCIHKLLPLLQSPFSLTSQLKEYSLYFLQPESKLKIGVLLLKTVTLWCLNRLVNFISTRFPFSNGTLSPITASPQVDKSLLRKGNLLQRFCLRA